MPDLLLVAVFILYVKIGHVIGRVSWSVWYEDERTKVVPFILFPYSHTMSEIGGSSSGPTIVSRCGSDGARRAYTALVTVIWPLKLAWNSVIVAICGALYVLAKAAEALIARDVRRRLRAIAIVPSPLPAVTRAPVPPSCEVLSRTPAEEIVQLMVERKRIVRRIRELQLLLTKKHGSGKFRVSNPNEEN